MANRFTLGILDDGRPDIRHAVLAMRGSFVATDLIDYPTSAVRRCLEKMVMRDEVKRTIVENVGKRGARLKFFYTVADNQSRGTA